MSKAERGVVAVAKLASGDTLTSDVRGSSDTTYRLEPTKWLKEVIEAAKSQWYFAGVALVRQTSEGQKDMVIPYKKKYLETSDYANTYSGGAVITATKLNSNDGIRVTPAAKAQRISIENNAIRTNAINIIADAKDELTNYAASVVESDIVTAILAATKSASGTAGYQWLYGGTATADSALATGDKLTPTLVSKAKMLLTGKRNYYWNAGALTKNTVFKNPWKNTNDAPIVLFVSPEIAHQLRMQDPFIDSSKYGGREVVLSGEIGKFMGVKVIESDFVPTYSSGGTAPDGGLALTTDIARCILLKAKKSHALVWGLKPSLKVSPFDREASVDIILELTYAASVIYSDAIVFIDVALF